MPAEDNRMSRKACGPTWHTTSPSPNTRSTTPVTNGPSRPPMVPASLAWPFLVDPLPGGPRLSQPPKRSSRPGSSASLWTVKKRTRMAIQSSLIQT